MSPTLKKLGIDRLSPQERLQLISEIWDSFNPAEQLEIPQSHRDELDKRIASADANPSAGASWQEVRARILQKKP